MNAIANTLKAINSMNAAGGMSNTDPATQQILASQMAGANPQLTRQCRRLYVGNLPVGMGFTEKILLDFFSAQIAPLGVNTPNPVLSVWLSQEGPCLSGSCCDSRVSVAVTCLPC